MSDADAGPTGAEDAAGRSGTATHMRHGAGEGIRNQPEGAITTILIAALGGEGGGVLSSWLVDAALADGRSVQATSVPGVAQRTGATTYYLEVGPRAKRAGEANSESGRGVLASGCNRELPVMALLPTPGNLDLLVASELLEAGRAAQNGFITRDRTTVIASTHRTYAISEKSAMGDGRFNDSHARRAVRELSRRHILTDLGAVAERSGTVLSSVMLGAVAGSEALPIPRHVLRASIERMGVAVEVNLRGFDAAAELVDGSTQVTSLTERGETDAQPALPSSQEPSTRVPASLALRVDALPCRVREIAQTGLARTVDFQDLRYGHSYLDRIERLLGNSGSGPAASGENAGRQIPGAASVEALPASRQEVVREVARQLALWMCFEDIIRVADLKTRRLRMDRVRDEVRAKPGQPVVVTEFLKPGVDEWCALLPAWLARRVIRAADRGGWRHRFKLRLRLRSSSVGGFAVLWTLARLKVFRRRLYRFQAEQERMEAWLTQVGEVCRTDPELALEAAKCANLIKGYGDTHQRGVSNFERTMASLADCADAAQPAASLRRLRQAALSDPEGTKLDEAIAELRAVSVVRK